MQQVLLGLMLSGAQGPCRTVGVPRIMRETQKGDPKRDSLGVTSTDTRLYPILVKRCTGPGSTVRRISCSMRKLRKRTSGIDATARSTCWTVWWRETRASLSIPWPMRFDKNALRRPMRHSAVCKRPWTRRGSATGLWVC